MQTAPIHHCIRSTWSSLRLGFILLCLAVLVGTQSGCQSGSEPSTGDDGRPARDADIDIEGVWDVSQSLQTPSCFDTADLVFHELSIRLIDDEGGIQVETTGGVFTGTYAGRRASWTGVLQLKNGYWLSVTSLAVSVEDDAFDGEMSWDVRDGRGGPIECSGTSTLAGTRRHGFEPSAPSNLLARLRDGGVELSWQDNAYNETRFDILVGGLGLAGGLSVEKSVRANSTETLVTGLSEGAVYRFQVQAVNEVGTSEPSNAASISFDDEGSYPAAPRGLEATVRHRTSVELTWTDEANDETAYLLQRVSADGTIVNGVLDADATSFVDGPLEPQQTYTYSVAAINAAGRSDAAGPVEIETLSDIVGTWAATATLLSDGKSSPGARGDIGRLCGVDDGQIQGIAFVQRAEIDQIGISAMGLELEGRLGSNSRGNVSGALQLGEASIPVAPSSLVIQASPRRIFVEGELDVSGCEASYELVLSPDVAPKAPEGLEAVGTSSTSVALRWIDRSKNELGYRLERRGGSGGAWSQVAKLGADATGWNDQGLTPSTTYEYRVIAYNLSGSAASAPVSTSTVAQAGPPGLAPFDVRAEALSSSTIELTWAELTDDEDEFRVLRRSGSSDTSVVGVLAANSTRFLDSGLAADTTYSYQIIAVNQQGSSPPSTLVSERTLPEPDLVAPSDLFATIVSDSEVQLTWQDNSTGEEFFAVFMASGDQCASSLDYLASAEADQTVFNVRGLAAGKHCFRVAAAIGEETSAPSNYVEITLGDLGPKTLRIVNDLRSDIEPLLDQNGQPVYDDFGLPIVTDWSKLNGIMRVRLGNYIDAVGVGCQPVINSSGYEVLNPNDSVPASSVPPRIGVGNSRDFDVSGLNEDYCILVQTGWWTYVPDFGSWQLEPASVIGCNVEELVWKADVIALADHTAGTRTLYASELLPPGNYFGSGFCQ